MLTPAEELGLSGVKLAGLVRRALLQSSERELVGLVRRLREESKHRHLSYWRDGRLEPIHVLALPLTALPEQLSYIRYACLTILTALKRLPALYWQDAEIRHILPLLGAEEEWFQNCWTERHGESNPVFGRLDAVVDLTSPMWKNALQFLEPNLSSSFAVFGAYLRPTR